MAASISSSDPNATKKNGVLRRAVFLIAKISSKKHLSLFHNQKFVIYYYSGEVSKESAPHGRTGTTREWIRMSMVVRNNLSAINTLNTLNRNHTALSKSLQQVSSGMRINSARDDASGYAISERMRVQIRSLNQDNLNTQNGHSMMKVAEGAVSSTVEILKTLKEKVINAGNDTNTDSDRAQIQKELDQSIDQINDNANVTYNGKYLVDGSKNGKSDGTFTALTNSSFHDTTKATTSLVNLKDRNGGSLNIQTGDTVSVSYVQNGRTYSTSFAVTNGTSLTTVLKKAEAIAEGETFANLSNASVVAVNGESDASAIINQLQGMPRRTSGTPRRELWMTRNQL